MLSRDGYRFILLPWEHRGADFDARPDLVATAKVGGVEQLFLLKVRANRAFFRLVEDETRIWGTTHEIEGEAVSFWKSEVEEGRIGRLFSLAGPIDVRGYERTEGAALVNQEGESWFCEWCSDLWWRVQSPPILQKYARTHRSKGVWMAQWKPPLRKLWNHNREAIAGRIMPKSERNTTSLRYVCGSQKQLEELLQLFCLAHFDALHEGTMNISRTWIPETFRFSLSSDSFDSEGKIRFDWAFHDPHREILKTFWTYNRVVGVEWKGQMRQNRDTLRGDWRHSSFVRCFDFPRLAPPMKRRVQARLELREWLHGKAPAEQIEAWLGSSS